MRRGGMGGKPCAALLHLISSHVISLTHLASAYTTSLPAYLSLKLPLALSKSGKQAVSKAILDGQTYLSLQHSLRPIRRLQYSRYMRAKVQLVHRLSASSIYSLLTPPSRPPWTIDNKDESSSSKLLPAPRVDSLKSRLHHTPSLDSTIPFRIITNHCLSSGFIR